MKKQRGFTIIEALIILLIIVLIGGVGWRVWHKYKQPSYATTQTDSPPSSTPSSQKLVSVKSILNLTYGPHNKQSLDVYTDTSGTTEPIVVMVHGGGWYSGDKKQVSQYANELASHGFVVFNINYRLDSASQPGYPLEVDDVQLATQWAMQNSTKYNGDKQNIILMGGSAGGTLVVLASQRLNAETNNTVKKVVSLSGPMDLVAKLASANTHPSSTSTAGADGLNILWYLGCSSYQNCSTQTAQAASPLYGVQATSCANFLILNSKSELIPLSQAESMQTALRNANCKSTLDELPGSAHAFSYYEQAQDTIIKFLQGT